MADLIIKPSVGTDNKLIIQNQAGNAVLTTDNSGVTLGTVTAGNLSNSAIVYPDGHVLNVIPWSSSKVNYQITSSSNVTTGTGFSITTGANTNKLFVSFSGTATLYDGNGPYLYSVYKLVFHSDSTTTGASPSGADITPAYEVGGNDTGESGRHDIYAVLTLTTSFAVSASTTYHCQIAGSMASTMGYFNINAVGDGYIMEIKA